jgi:hypothetical protein
MDAELARRRRRHGRALRGLRRGRRPERQPVEQGQRRLSLLAAPAADGGRRHAAPRLGRGGLGILRRAARQPPRHRRADGRASVGHEASSPKRCIERTGTANIWTAMTRRSRPRPRLRAGLLALAQLLGRQPDRAHPARHLGRRHRHRDRRDRLELPARPPRHLGLRHAAAAHARRHRAGRRDGAGARAGTKQGFLFVLDRRTGEPLFPIEDRPCRKHAEGEVTAPTQPVAMTPEPGERPLHPARHLVAGRRHERRPVQPRPRAGTSSRASSRRPPNREPVLYPGTAGPTTGVRPPSTTGPTRSTSTRCASCR